MKRRKKNKVINIDEARESRKQKKEKLAAKKAEQNEAQPVRKNRVKLFAKLYAAAALAFVVAVLIFAVRIGSLQTDLKNSNMEYELAADKKSRLENELEHINEPEYVEQQARARLRMVKPGELLYVLPEEEKAPEGEKAAEEGEDVDGSGEQTADDAR